VETIKISLLNRSVSFLEKSLTNIAPLGILKLFNASCLLIILIKFNSLINCFLLELRLSNVPDKIKTSIS
jgi:hypothetical protein